MTNDIIKKNAAENKANKLLILHVYLEGLLYFQLQNKSIPLFLTGYDNEKFKELCLKDLDDIRKSEQLGNLVASSIHRCRDYIGLNRSYGIDPALLPLLLTEKYEEAKRIYGFTTLYDFAQDEIEKINGRKSKCRDWFPVFKQWLRFLEQVKPIQPAISKNIFNNLPIEIATAYFMQLANNNNKDGKPYLISEKVTLFISKAFGGDSTIPKQTISYIRGEQHDLWLLFYKFYNSCATDGLYEAGKQTKEKYVKLLTDNFTNWEYQSVYDNFNRSNKRIWKELIDFIE